MDSKRRKTGDQNISELRLKSRHAYLAQREAQQLALLRRQVAEEAEEEERLGDKLSEKERREFAKNRETLKLAEARNAIDEHRDGYILPDADYSNKNEVLTKRHKEPGYEKSEVQLWEEEQMRKIQGQTKAPERVQEQDYEYVFDENAIKWDVDPTFDSKKHMLETQLDEAEKAAASIAETRKSLPIYAFKDELLAAVRDHQCLIVSAATGSGKTTQMPQYLTELSDILPGCIACTQPRRVAAMSVARRVAEEMGVRLGKEVGYSVRFEDVTSPETKIKYMTDGTLLREALTDSLLSSYSVIILDEAHERTLATDILMGLLKDIMLARPELKVLVTSATLNAQLFSDFFYQANVFNIPGRVFPVSIHHVPSPEANYLNAAVITAFQIHCSAPLDGDILIFLTGSEEIQAAAQNIEDTAKKLGSRVPEVIVAPIYASLSPEDQSAIFTPTPAKTRKIVVATNIAESSVTIPNIKYVIDCGLSKINSYSSQLGTEQLVVTPISRASAEQRAGRAGRTSAGRCFRLYTKYAYLNELPAQTPPEITRTNLDSTILLLKSLSINDVIGFPFLDAPSFDQFSASLESLYALGALGDDGRLTKVGRQMSELPVSPQLAKVIIAADKLSCVEEVLKIAAMVDESSLLFIRPKNKQAEADAARKRFSPIGEGGDHMAYLTMYNQWEESEYDPRWSRENYLQQRSLERARLVVEQLTKLCDRIEVTVTNSGANSECILKSFASGFFSHAARLQKDGQSYAPLGKNGLTTYIHPSSCLARLPIRPKWVIYNSILSSTKDWMSSVFEVNPAWLTEVAPHYHKKESLEKLGVEKKMPKERSKMSAGHNMTIKTRTPKGAAEVYGRAIQK
jgi:pre-mRNA-splicing factor ATP-dependent RNA helicase DHX16